MAILNGLATLVQSFSSSLQPDGAADVFKLRSWSHCVESVSVLFSTNAKVRDGGQLQGASLPVLKPCLLPLSSISPKSL